MSKPFDCVVAVDATFGIGRAGDLPWPRLKEDLRFLRRVTTEAPEGRRNAVIMGRKTFGSVPAQMCPLPGRLNVSISRRAQPELPDGVIAATSLDDALDRAAARDDIAGLFVLGGAEIYRLAFPHPRSRFIYLTVVDGVFDCDTFIPAPDALGYVREEVLAEHRDDASGIRYQMERWGRPR